MGRGKKKDIKWKLCELTYRKKGWSEKLLCVKKSLDEVCKVLNPKC